MKKFKQFKSEQQVINEIGPFGAVMMGAMGIFGGGFAAYKMFKTAKSAIKGYRETKADKKAREQDGFTMSLKVYNPATDKEELQDFFVDPENGNDDLKKLGYELPTTMGGKIKAPSDDDLDKMEKEANNKAKRAGSRIKRKINDPNTSPEELSALLTTDQQTQLADKKTKDTEDADTKASDADEKDKKQKAKDRKPTSFWVGKSRDDMPKSKEAEVRGLESKAIKDGNGVFDWQDKWDTEETPAGWSKVGKDGKKYDKENDGDNFEYKKTDDLTTENVSSQRVLKFGEFISEDVMKDLKLATKSKKDSEITLDDGADIPIDPLTASILVKYIEGLGSSEKNKTINKIQRTERAFMKVLGQAHGE